MDKAIIRKAVPGDEQMLAYIQTESWKAAFAGILSPEELERCTNLEKAEQMYYSVLRREGCNMAIEFVADDDIYITTESAQKTKTLQYAGEDIKVIFKSILENIPEQETSSAS